MNTWTRSNTKRQSQTVRAVPVVEVKAVTWNKDSHGLFDYENSYYDMKKFVITENTVLTRVNNEIVNIGENVTTEDPNKNDSEQLISIVKDKTWEGKYYIDMQSQSSSRRVSTYLIVRSLKCRDGKTQRGYSLIPGDILKLGRVEHKVIEIQTGNGPSTVKGIEDSNMFPEDTLFDANTQTEATYDADRICKYCLMDRVSDNDLENLMLYPCKCSGSSAGVHFSCLRNWIQYKIIAKHSHNVANYQWKKLECEICLEPLPRRIQHGTGIFELISIERPQTPYMIVEKIGEDKKSSSFTIIVPEVGQTINMGRGHQCDFRISDISVSRVHAHLKFEEGKFLLYDNDSKFGTLVLLNQDYTVREDKAAVQIGRTVFTFVQKKAPTEGMLESNLLN